MNHRTFARELREDALVARMMAERLERRAAEHDALARDAEEPELTDALAREAARSAFLRGLSAEDLARRVA